MKPHGNRRMAHESNLIESKDIFFILAASFCFVASPMLVTPLITGFSGSIGASAALMGDHWRADEPVLAALPPAGGESGRSRQQIPDVLFGRGAGGAGLRGVYCGVHPGLVIAARVVNGVGYACSSVCVSTWLSNLLPKEKIGSGMGFYGMMNALAMAVAPCHRYQCLSCAGLPRGLWRCVGVCPGGGAADSVCEGQRHSGTGARRGGAAARESARAHCGRPGAAHCPHR